jgi:hypothetical protein
METVDIPVAIIDKAWQENDGDIVELVVTLNDGRPAAIQFPYRLVPKAVETLHHGRHIAEATRVAKFGKDTRTWVASQGPIRQLVDFTVDHAINAETNSTDVLLQIATRDGEIMSFAITNELAELLVERLRVPD